MKMQDIKVDYSKDIRSIKNVSEANLVVKLEDVIDETPLDENLKEELKEFSRKYDALSFYIFTCPTNYALFEGRGRYFIDDFNGDEVTLYSKGIGSMLNLWSMKFRRGHYILDGFGPDSVGNYFYDKHFRQDDFPRVI
jgi:hypothetical protein